VLTESGMGTDKKSVPDNQPNILVYHFFWIFRECAARIRKSDNRVRDSA
jgi:hypothetical protein